MGWFTEETGLQSWQDAEVNAARLMRVWGYERVKVSKAGADGGIDVRARGAVAQVKHHQKPVGRPTLQQLVGAANGASMLFFALSGYSKEAIEYADRYGMALFQYDISGSARAVNGQARKVGKPGGAQGFDHLDRTVLALAPGLKPYVKQRGAWRTAVMSALGTVIVPVNYGSDLGVVKTVLAVLGLSLTFLVAIAILVDRGRSAEHAQDRQDAREARSLEQGTPDVTVPIKAGGEPSRETRDPMGPGRLGGIWPESVIGLVFAAIPIFALRWNGGGWWWIPYGFGWFLCWLFAMLMFIYTGMRVHDRLRPHGNHLTT